MAGDQSPILFLQKDDREGEIWQDYILPTSLFCHGSLQPNKLPFGKFVVRDITRGKRQGLSLHEDRRTSALSKKSMGKGPAE